MTERDSRQRQRQANQQRDPSQSGLGKTPNSDSADPTRSDGKSSTDTGESNGSNGSGGRGAGSKNSGSSGKNTKLLIALGVAVAIGLGAFFGMGGSSDQISDQEIQSRQNSYQQLAAGAGMPLKLVSSDEMDSAMASLPDSVTEEQRIEIVQNVSEGRLQLAWLTVWDTHAEDGDVLRFESSSSIPVEVMALNAKTTVAIPYPADGSVLVTGVQDGGGGITIALESGATQIAWPTMQPGDTLNLPVTPGY